MKRENEFTVGLVVIAAFAVVVGGALWLSGAHIGRTEAIYTARFRTVGGRTSETRSSCAVSAWDAWRESGSPAETGSRRT